MKSHKNNLKFFGLSQVYIYGYRKLANKTYFYVGSTNEHPEVRAARHLRQAKKGTHENKRLAQLLLTNNFQIDILAICNERTRLETEYYWIMKFKSENHKLVNSRNPLKPRQALPNVQKTKMRKIRNGGKRKQNRQFARSRSSPGS